MSQHRSCLFAAIVVVAATAAGPACRSETPFPGRAWQTKTPAELGLDAAPLDALAAHLQERGRDAAGVVVKDGYIIKTWGDPSARIDWASAGKSVLSTMLLFALREGRLSSLHDPIIEWGWNGAAHPGTRLQGMDRRITFFHLANMTSGFDRVERPGEAFAYNGNAVQLYARTLVRVFDAESKPGAFNEAALQPFRLGALEFEDGPLFGAADRRFEARGDTSVVASPRDLARIGWFWLNRGRWKGRQLLPASYFDDFVKPHVPPDMPLSLAAIDKYLLIGSWGNPSSFDAPFGPGLYGLHWWFNGTVGLTGKRHWPDGPPDTFAAIGNYPDKAIFVIPSLGMVIAAHGDWTVASSYRPPLAGSRGQPHRYWHPGDPEGPFNRALRLLTEAAAPRRSS